MGVVDQTFWPDGTTLQREVTDSSKTSADGKTETATTTTTAYTSKGVRERSIQEDYEAPTADKKARLNLVKRITDEWDDDGDAVQRQTIEYFGEGVNQTPKSMVVIQYQMGVGAGNHETKKWSQFTYNYTWDAKRRAYIWERTTEQDQSGAKVNTWTP